MLKKIIDLRKTRIWRMGWQEGKQKSQLLTSRLGGSVIFQVACKLCWRKAGVFFEGVGKNVDVFKAEPLCDLADAYVLVAQDPLGFFNPQRVFVGRRRGMKLVGKVPSQL